MSLATSRLLADAGARRLRTLAGLGGYACAHTGSCCRAGWPIPVEPAPLRILRAAIAAGRLTSAAQVSIDTDNILGRLPDGVCGFHTPHDAMGGCAVERRLGAEALPASCRQFPRILLADDRSWHQSLSVWCPTAAAMVVNGESHIEHFLSFTTVDWSLRVHVEGLDATHAWPPLLRPNVLSGLEDYTGWELTVLSDVLAAVGRDVPLRRAMSALLGFTASVRAWTPNDGPLSTCVEQQRGTLWALMSRDAGKWQGDNLTTLLNDLLDRTSETWRPMNWPHDLSDPVVDPTPLSRQQAERALACYLGTRLCGSWVAYQGQGWLSVAASLTGCLALAALALSRSSTTTATTGLLINAIRATDWLVLHLLEREDWAAWCSQAEAPGGLAHLDDLVNEADAALDVLCWTP